MIVEQIFCKTYHPQTYGVPEIIKSKYKNDRRKRGVQMFGNLYHSCYNVVLEDKFKT